MDRMQEQRFFLKDTIRKQTDFSRTDQSMGVPPPAITKPYDPDATRIALPGMDSWKEHVRCTDVVTAIGNRRSRRKFTSENLTLDELSFLLWATQGITSPTGHGHALRTVPSAGARHSFETYVFAMRVEGITQSLCRYLPVQNELLVEREINGMPEKVTAACLGQEFAGTAAATFVWTTIPYRMEWRYSLAAHRVILIDVGHVCQNLYTACESIGAGMCAIAAYDQQKLDELLGVDGEDEFAIYAAPVGKV